MVVQGMKIRPNIGGAMLAKIHAVGSPLNMDSRK